MSAASAGGSRSASARQVQRAGVQLLERLLPGEAGESWAERLAWLDPPGVRLQDDGEPRVLTVARCPLPGRTGPCRFPVAVLLWLRDGQGPLALYGTVEHAHEMRRTFGPGWSRHRSQLGAFPEWAQLLAPPQDDARPVRCAHCRRARPYDHDEMRRLAAEAAKSSGSRPAWAPATVRHSRPQGLRP